MSQSLANLYVHVIFSTKDREAVLTPEIAAELYPYMATVLANLDCSAVIVGGMPDHVHVLCRLSRTMSVSKLVEEVKTSSSRWLKTKSDALSRFSWQRGYGAFSVSESNVATVTQYIDRQVEHHRKLSFRDEFRALLERNGMEFDERYVWD